MNLCFSCFFSRTINSKTYTHIWIPLERFYLHIKHKINESRKKMHITFPIEVIIVPLSLYRKYTANEIVTTVAKLLCCLQNCRKKNVLTAAATAVAHNTDPMFYIYIPKRVFAWKANELRLILCMWIYTIKTTKKELKLCIKEELKKEEKYT